MNRGLALALVAIMLASLLTGCAAAPTPATVVQTVEVEKQVVQTVEVEKKIPKGEPVNVEPPGGLAQ